MGLGINPTSWVKTTPQPTWVRPRPKDHPTWVRTCPAPNNLIGHGRVQVHLHVRCGHVHAQPNIGSGRDQVLRWTQCSWFSARPNNNVSCARPNSNGSFLKTQFAWVLAKTQIICVINILWFS
jgi:hypothetical protein